MSFLLVGGDAEIAKATREELARRKVEVVATSRRAPESRYFLDLSYPLGSWQPPEGVTAACIFAAVTRLRNCERDRLNSRYVNVVQTIELARRLAEKGIYVVFLSSSQIFDGSKKFFDISDEPHPISEYGRQKVETEKGLMRIASRHDSIGILRLSKVFSATTEQVRDWPEDVKKGVTVVTFNDMYVSPIPAKDVSYIIVEMLVRRQSGIFQLSGKADISYAQMGRYIVNYSGAPLHLLNERAAFLDLPSGSTPRYTTLNSSAVTRTFGVSPREPWEVIESFLQQK